MRHIVTAWGLKAKPYSVETWLVTARPNYFGKDISFEYPDIKYFTYDEILTMQVDLLSNDAFPNCALSFI